ncbi:MAG: ATP-grasp domain-containing protein [Longimicrobiales bacterium]
MSSFEVRPLAIYYEHPDWFRPLFAELDRRGTPYVRLQAGSHRFDPAEEESPYGLVFNRMSPSAYLRGHGHAIFYTTQYLAHLERLGVRVINGLGAWQVEISKARQLTLLEQLGLPYPRARVIHDAREAPAAADGLRYPIAVKPNIGGSGAGVRRFDTPDSLTEAAQSRQLDLGIDHTALVQEFIPPESSRIVRVEVLDGRFLYAIRIYTPGDSFNLCPADVCQSVDGDVLERAACPADAPLNGLRVEGYTPREGIIASVERIAAAAGIELGGIEYVIDERDGRLCFYDINALSNFVADAPRIVGFDPFAKLVDWLETEAAKAGALVEEVV